MQGASGISCYVMQRMPIVSVGGCKATNPYSCLKQCVRMLPFRLQQAKKPSCTLASKCQLENGGIPEKCYRWGVGGEDANTNT